MKTNLPIFILTAALLTPALLAQKASNQVPSPRKATPTPAPRVAEKKPKLEAVPARKAAGEARVTAAISRSAERKPKIETVAAEKKAAPASRTEPTLLAQQAPKSEPVALPEPVLPAAVPPVVPAQPKPSEPPVQPAKPEEAEIEPLLPPKSAPAGAPANGAPVPGGRAPVRVTNGIVLNFESASLPEVLNYLSEAAGFAIVREAQLNGTVNVVSRQPLSPDEAVELLNTVLAGKGLVAIRSGRILKIVNRSGAQKMDIPVELGSEWERIPQSDRVVTQILPVKFGEAAKLVENLRPLLPDSATISANESSNAIIMTDTQNNIRRIAQIIKAIDTSVTSISQIHVYPLQFADAKALATLVTQLFANSTTSATGRGRGGGGGGRGGFPGFGGGGFPGFGGGGGNNGGGDSGQSEARQANQRVIAVADEQSNSLVVSAPDDTIPDLTKLIEKLDTSITDITQTKIFRLEHADSTELAAIITSLYADTTQQNQRNRNGQGRGGFGGFGGFGGGAPGGGQGGNNQQSQRSLLEAKVVAVGDPRTNALIVTAAPDTMAEIAETVGRLDTGDDKKQRVHTYALQHADADAVANVLRGMLGDPQAIQLNQQGGVLNRRQTDGAIMDTSDFNNSGGGGRGGGGRR